MCLEKPPKFPRKWNFYLHDSHISIRYLIFQEIVGSLRDKNFYEFLKYETIEQKEFSLPLCIPFIY